ncbi:AAA family ATPase [Dyella lipolytica]|uniref:AAA family ATPase n=1 Tax=Dyella lipolytica TaxID=1867835 RepID=A0ABW8ISG4_9GAMM|nr:AAA family ATPase [Dyella lipolytica]
MTSPYLKSVKLRRDKVASFDEYPFCLPVVSQLEELELHPAVTFFVGENGSGKSTLLEAIAVAWGFNPEGGTKNFRFQTRASHSLLNEYLRLVKPPNRARDGFFLRAESMFNVASEIEHLDDEPGGPPIIDSYGGRSLHEQSHGESILAVMMHRFNGNGLYILDEPEAALSPSRQLAMLRRLHDLVGQQSQFLIATHSPMLMAYPNAWIYQITAQGIELVKLEDTEHYLVARRFLNDPHQQVSKLLE